VASISYRKAKIKISWSDYLNVTVRVVPLSVCFTLIVLAYWVQWVF